MFKRILVPLDGSELAERAVPVAAQIARASGGSILLFGVVTAPIEYGSSFVPASSYGWGMEQDELKRVSEYLQQTASLPLLEGVPVETQAMAEAVAPAILTAERTYQADLVIMSSHGYTGVKRWVLGSVAQKVARHSSAPVLVLRADGAIVTADQPQRVLVPLDGSPLAEAALEPAMQLAAALSGTAPGELHLLRVITVPSTSGKFGGGASLDFERTVLAEEKQAAHTYLQALEQQLRKSMPAPMQLTTSIVVDNDIAAAIIYAGEPAGATGDKAYAAIAMATHGRSGIRHWTLGSITERVLGTTRLPLLIVRPKAPKVQQEQREPVEAGIKEGDVPWVGLL
jgi:nucleotide-binding universal stress UspA family protein